jgi:anti-anti-sigma factor
MALEVKVEDRGRDHVVSLSGELDLASAPALVETLAAESADGARVVLDLRGLEFMDSTGLRSILMAAKAAHERGVAFALVKGPSAVHRVFEITQTVERLSWISP